MYVKLLIKKTVKSPAIKYLLNNRLYWESDKLSEDEARTEFLADLWIRRSALFVVAVLLERLAVIINCIDSLDGHDNLEWIFKLDLP